VLRCRNARDSGHSCILIAHNIHHVFQVVDRIAVMRHGKVVAATSIRNTRRSRRSGVITGELITQRTDRSERFAQARCDGFLEAMLKIVRIVQLNYGEAMGVKRDA
jgi:ABC-type sugar transport system ATPase subunit